MFAKQVLSQLNGKKLPLHFHRKDPLLHFSKSYKREHLYTDTNTDIQIYIQIN